MLGTHDVDQNVGKDPNSVLDCEYTKELATVAYLVTSDHQIRKPEVVVQRDLRRRHTSVRSALAELQDIQGLQSQPIIP